MKTKTKTKRNRKAVNEHQTKVTTYINDLKRLMGADVLDTFTLNKVDEYMMSDNHPDGKYRLWTNSELSPLYDYEFEFESGSVIVSFKIVISGDPSNSISLVAESNSKDLNDLLDSFVALVGSNTFSDFKESLDGLLNVYKVPKESR